MTRPPTIDAQAMQGILAVLQTIAVEYGDNFDLGANVVWGKISNTLDQIPCVFLMEGETTNHDEDFPKNMPGKTRAMSTLVRKRVLVEAHVPCDITQPNLAGHAALQDLKTALFDNDRMYGTSFITATKWISDTIGRREDGTKILPVLLQFDITYTTNQALPKT